MNLGTLLTREGKRESEKRPKMMRKWNDENFVGLDERRV
jgi:hypothetical protein